ncbi:MAG TPA: hypothetical protein VE225_09305 [Rubrobacteraceae bacterium]|nr:hypothetical protein [Rubrobacteraceae bacterium]
MEESDRTWRGSPLDMGDGIDPYGIREVVIEFDNGDSDTFRPRLRDEFYSYELQQMATYIETLASSVRKGRRR